MVILVVTVGLSVLDVTLALTLGGIMLLTLLVMPPLFYRAGKPAGESMTRLRGQYRQQLTSWLQGQAESYCSTPAIATGGKWKNRSALAGCAASPGGTDRALSGADAADWRYCGYRNAVARLRGRWRRYQPGALDCAVCLCALAAFEALAPVTGAFQHLGQVIASAKRITQITEQEPEVCFAQGKDQKLDRVSLSLNQVTFSYPQQPSPALENISLQVKAGEHIAILGRTGCGKSTLLQLLTRAWDPAEGEILLNDQPLAQLNEATLRQAMSVVPQRVHLFSATLRDNLLLASPTPAMPGLPKRLSASV